MTPAEERQARVIARASFQHNGKRTRDVDTMRAAAQILHRDYGQTHQPDREESPR